MTITWAAVIFGVLSLYGYLLFRRGAFLQGVVLAQFNERIHREEVRNVLSEEEHEAIHDKLDIFHLQVLSCLVALLVGCASSIFFIGLVTSGGNGAAPGYILAIAFAYLAANYNMNKSMSHWMSQTENNLLTRVMDQHAKANGQTLEEYFDEECAKWEAILFGDDDATTIEEQQALIGEEFDDALYNEGFDPTRDYDETMESRREFIQIFLSAATKLNEKYTEPREK